MIVLLVVTRKIVAKKKIKSKIQNMKYILLTVLVVSAVMTTACASKKECKPSGKTVITCNK